MIANMNEKGRQTKLLAAFAILAMVVCAFAVAMPSDGVDGITTPSEAAEFEGFGAEMTGTETAPKEYKLMENIVLDAASTIPEYNVLYTNGFTITTTSTNTLTVTGELVANGGGIIATASPAEITGTGTILVDNKATFVVGSGTTAVNWIGTNGVYNITSGTVTLTINTGFVAEIDGNVTVQTTKLGANDKITVNEGSVLTVAGTVTGITKDKLVNNGEIKFTGTGSIDGEPQNNEGAVFNAWSNGKVYGTLSATGYADNYTGALRVYGSASTALSFSGTTSDDLRLSLAAGASYSGTVTMVVDKITYTISLTATNGTYSDLVKYDSASAGILVTGSPTTLDSGADASKITFIASSNVTVSSVSAVKAADATGDAKVTLDGVAVNGNVSTALTVGTNGIVVPTGATLTFMTGGSVITGSNSMTVLGDVRMGNGVTVNNQINNTGGKVFTNRLGMVTPYATVPTISDGSTAGVVLISSAITINSSTTPEQALEIIQSQVPFQLDDVALNILTSVTISSTVYLPDGTAIYVGATAEEIQADGFTTIINVGNGTRGTLTFDNAKVYSYAEGDSEIGTTAANGKDGIVVSPRNGLTINQSMIFAVVDAPTNASVTINNKDALYENTTSGVTVGYGTTLNLAGDVENNITVYGTIVINSDVVVPADAEFNAYNGSTITINGDLEIVGTANFYDGSTTVVNGTVEISEPYVGAEMNVGINPYDDGQGEAEPINGANFTIAAEGSLTVSSTRSGYAGENKLIVNNEPASYSSQNGWEPRFLVLGTLTMNGTLEGTVYDQGTINFNGKGNGAAIVLYDGVTLTDVSVTGDLIVADWIIASENLRDNREQSTGNIVTLTDVKGATITTKVETERWTETTQTGDVNHTDYYTVMDVSGTINAVNNKIASTIELYAGATKGVGEDNDIFANITVSGAIALGKNVTLSFNGGNINVAGTIDSLSKEDANESTILGSKIDGNGSTVTVTGHIQALEGSFDISGIELNAVHYQVTGTGSDADTVDHYVGFNAGVAAGPEADDDEIVVYGTVTATETVTIPAGLTVTMQNGSVIKVNKDVTVTQANGATIDGSSATIDVDGTFVSENYDIDLTIGEVVSDVVIDETPKMTWTSLANAIGMGMTDIILNGPLHITEDLEIPAGVKVSTNYEVDIEQTAENSYAIFVDEATLTVNGTLYMGENTEGRIIFSEEDAEMYVNGTFYARLMGVTFDDATATPEIYNLAGAHYRLIDGAYDVYYVSSIDIAATTVSNNVNFNESAGVVIKGVLTSGDVSFVAAEDMTIGISIVSLGTGPEDVTVLRLGTVTLEDATLSIGNNCRVSGTIASATGTVTIADAALFYYATEDGEEPETVINGSFTGSVTVSAGEVSVNNAVTVGANSTLTVSSGAVLNVPTSTSLTVNDPTDADKDNAVIDGTINFVPADGLKGTGELLVNGTANVGDFTLSTAMRVTGQLNIAEGKTLTITGASLFLGATPSELGEAATGAVAGTIVFNAGSENGIVAYPGSSVSDAKIQVNSATNESEAAVTTYVINGTNYATIYGYDGNLTIAEAIALDGQIDLTGWENPTNWYAAQDYASTDKNVNGDDLGDYTNVYSNVLAIEIGGKISKDAGIILTIDDIVVFSDSSWSSSYPLRVGEHTIAWSERTGYNIENVTVTFNGVAVENGGTITITADMEDFLIVAEGAVPGAAPGGETSTGGDDGMGLTDYLLIILVVLIVVMAIMVALRLMRNKERVERNGTRTNEYICSRVERAQLTET